MIKTYYEKPECEVFDTAPCTALCASNWPGEIESMGEIDFDM